MSSINVQPLPNHHRAFFMEIYKSLSFNGIQVFPNLVPTKVREHLPEFSGKISESACQHLQDFLELMGDFEIN